MIRCLPLGRMDGEEAFLLSALDARSHASGRRALPRMEGRWRFERFWGRGGDVIEVRAFAVAVRLVDDLRRVRDSDLRKLVLLRIDRGELVVVGPRLESLPDSIAVERRRLVRDITSALRGPDLRLDGQTYVLVLGADLGRLANFTSFVAVAPPEAARLLSIKQPAIPPAAIALIERVGALLAANAQSPEPDRFVLLRRAGFVAQAPRVTEPGQTPSQLRKAAEKTWIEIEVHFDNGKPYSGSVQVHLADGSLVTAKTDARGVLRLDGVVPGVCQVTLPEVDGRAWSPA